jgi:hypothetical protein
MRIVRFFILGIPMLTALLWVRSTVAGDTLTATTRWPGTLRIISNAGYVRVIASPVRGSGIQWQRSDYTGFT